MTRANLSTLIAGWLDDTQQAYFTPTLVNLWLNLAQRQVQMMLLQAGENWYETPVTTSTVVGQADYVLPVDFMVEHRLELVLSGTGTTEVRRPLQRLTTNEVDQVGNYTGDPIAYCLKKNRFTLYPTPDKVLTVRLFYSPRVADMTQDTDSPDVPEQYMEFVAILAAFDGFIKDDRIPDNLLVKKNAYELLLKQSAEDRTQDRSRQVIITEDFG